MAKFEEKLNGNAQLAARRGIAWILDAILSGIVAVILCGIFMFVWNSARSFTGAQPAPSLEFLVALTLPVVFCLMRTICEVRGVQTLAQKQFEILVVPIAVLRDPRGSYLRANRRTASWPAESAEEILRAFVRNSYLLLFMLDAYYVQWNMNGLYALLAASAVLFGFHPFDFFAGKRVVKEIDLLGNPSGVQSRGYENWM